jgi:hypothetical protein
MVGEAVSENTGDSVTVALIVGVGVLEEPGGGGVTVLVNVVAWVGVLVKVKVTAGGTVAVAAGGAV